MNRQDRRRAEAQRRTYNERLRKDAVQRQRLRDTCPSLEDPRVRNGLAYMLGTVDFVSPDGKLLIGCGHCLERSLIALEVFRRGGADCQLELGSMLYRVGPDPMRDVIAFCGPGNAGGHFNGHPLFHAWLSLGGCIVDFSAIDWPNFDVRNKVTLPDGVNLGPIQWSITPPKYFWRPRDELTKNWRPTGTRELGEAWYGPFNDDAISIAQDTIHQIHEEAAPMINDIVDQLYANAQVPVPPRIIQTLIPFD